MDKNTVIGLLLIFALFLGFSFYQTSQVKKRQAEQEAQLTEEMAKQAEETANTLSLDAQSDTNKTAEPVASNRLWHMPPFRDQAHPGAAFLERAGG